jgi:hypothetical protein
VIGAFRSGFAGTLKVVAFAAGVALAIRLLDALDRTAGVLWPDERGG